MPLFSRVEYKQKPTLVVVFIGVFAALFALGNFIAIPTIASMEHVITIIIACLFGPYIAAPAAVIGELVVMPIAPPEFPIFIGSILIADFFTSFIMGYGRHLTLVLQKKFNTRPVVARTVVESGCAILMIFARYSFYLLYTWLFIELGYPFGEAFGYFVARLVPTFIGKLVTFPIGIIALELIRKAIKLDYFDIDLEKYLAETVRAEGGNVPKVG